jgi:hypothetical protein
MTQQKTSDDGMLSYEDTTFTGLLRIDMWQPIKNWSVLWAFILASWFVIYTIIHGNFQNDYVIFSDKITSTLLGASAGIFGIVIAALTLTLTLFHQKLLPEMLKENLLQEYLFPFWFAVILWASNITLCIFIMFFHALDQKCLIAPFFAFELFLFLFATFYTVKLTGLVIQLALQRAQINS